MNKSLPAEDGTELELVRTSSNEDLVLCLLQFKEPEDIGDNMNKLEMLIFISLMTIIKIYFMIFIDVC